MRRYVGVLAAAGLLMVSACGGSPDSASSPTVGGPPLTDATYTLNCAVRYDIETKVVVTDYHKGWEYPRGLSCVANVPDSQANKVDGPLSQKQIDAVAAAYPGNMPADRTRTSLTTLYAICSETGPLGSLAMLIESRNGQPSAEQLAEVRGALVLCADHPDAGKYASLLAAPTS